VAARPCRDGGRLRRAAPAPARTHPPRRVGLWAFLVRCSSFLVWKGEATVETRNRQPATNNEQPTTKNLERGTRNPPPFSVDGGASHF
jgi:hypothetical protein